MNIGYSDILKRGVAPPALNEKEFFGLLQAFFSYYISERKTAKFLAKELANRAKLMPSEVIYLLEDEKNRRHR